MSKILRYDRDGNPVWVDKSTIKPSPKAPRSVVSDQLGCIAQQVDEMREDARLNGFSAIEWKPDPTVMVDGQPTFYQAHCSSPDQYQRYAKHRGLSDRNSRNGGHTAFADGELEAIQKRVRSRIAESEQYLNDILTFHRNGETDGSRSDSADS